MSSPCTRTAHVAQSGDAPDMGVLNASDRVTSEHQAGARKRARNQVTDRRTDGSDLPTRDLMAAIVAPQRGALAPAYLVYNNYNVILKWNRSDYFATAVGRLADRLAAGG